MLHYIGVIVRFILKILDFLTPFVDLIVRCAVAWDFFKSGWLKITSWQSTLLLFQNEFHVPLLNPHVAAVLGTGAELILPVLLVLGLGGRISILVLFIFNVIAAISYPFLWTPAGAQGLQQHIVWAMLLGLLMCHGSGKISIDYWIRKKHGERWSYAFR